MAGTRKTGRKKQPAKLRRAHAPVRAKRAAAVSELARARDARAATADILRVIGASPTDVQPVFDAIVESAARLLHGVSAAVYRLDGEMVHLAAFTSTSGSGDTAFRAVFPRPLADAAFQEYCIREREPCVVSDVESDARASERARRTFAARGYRSAVFVPMFKEGAPVGNISVARRDPGTFTEDDIALLKSFADQAVIAIENVRLFNETKEALERQTATSEILSVISGSPTDLHEVFEAVLANAIRLCEGDVAVLWRYDGTHLRVAAHKNADEDGAAYLEQHPLELGTYNPTPRAALERRVIHELDVFAVPDYRPLIPRGEPGTNSSSTQIAVPLVREDRLLGVITVWRFEKRPFTDKQVALLGTFADQAVIAIENVRLFNETKEALEQQTATADILKVISGSPTDVQPVFDSIAERAATLCGARFAFVTSFDGEWIHMRATYGPGAEGHRAGYPMRPGSGSIAARVIRDGAAVQIEDMLLDPEYVHKEAAANEGFRSGFGVPMLRDGRIFGCITVTRPEPGAMPDRLVHLLQTFADQAVIAIENVRLFNETKEALERQTATAEILQVMSRSQTVLQPVFDTIAANAMRLCDGDQGLVFSYDGEMIHIASLKAMTPEGEAATRHAFPQPASLDSMTGRAILTRATAHSVDVLAERNYVLRDEAQIAGWRSMLSVPMLRAGEPIGAITVIRRQPMAFADNHIALLKTFADQAVIAIENTRLFNETKEALERQTATAEILEVMSRSQSDLRPMFDTIAANAQRLCVGDQALVAIVEGGLVHLASIKAMTPEEEERTRRDWPRPPGRGAVTSRAILTRTICHVSDVLQDPEYELGHTAQAAGWRSVVSVPMIREGNPVGTVTVMRRSPGPFSDAQIALLKTFADQAVIAIENVRLFNETKEALERQTATAEILAVMSRSQTDLQPVFDTIAANAMRLCDGDQGLVFSYDGNMIHIASLKAMTPEGEAATQRAFPQPASLDSMTGRAILTRATAHSVDVLAERNYVLRDEAQIAGWRSMLSVPMLRAGEPIGAITVIRRQPTAFTDNQVALLKTFADQAVIAIENVRLFNETKEALEQQTATAEILRVISSTPTDVQPVFDAIVASALRIFSGMRVAILLDEGDHLRVVAAGGALSHVRKGVEAPRSRDSASGTAILERRVFNVRDTEAPGAPRTARDNGRADGFRAMAAAPLLREGNAIGVVIVMLKEPGGLSDKQLALLKTFADQAVIAIENTRLFRELEARTEALSKSVGQLRAMSEVGHAISSTLDLEKVLQTIVQRAVQLAELDSGAIYEYEEDRQVFRQRGAVNIAEEIVELFGREPLRLGEGAIGHAGLTREPVQVPDMEASYRSRFRELLLRAGWRSLLVVPLLSEGRLLGALTVARKVAGEFPPEVVELLGTFATQSAIAIQNARLFREIEEKGRQLEVASRHKSDFLASMSHELRTPLNAILGFNEMILEGVYGEVPADMTEPLADIQTSGKHLLRLINNVLDLAKIEAGRMELALADYSVQDVVEGVRATLRPLAEAKGLELLASVPQDLPLAHGDSGRLTQCLMNLAGNSLKFTKAGRVSISVEQNGGGTLVWRVADTGIGIPPDKIGSLFTEFKQTDATIASEYGGTGLGLSITRKFVEMHGGRIWVESEPGEGSEFIFEVPLRAQTP